LKNNNRNINISFIGTGAAITKSGRYPSGLVLNKNIVVDTPPQIVSHLKKMNIPLEGIKYIFLTHAHPDHTLGMVMLVQDWTVLGNISKPVNVIGPEGIKKYVRELLEKGLLEQPFDMDELFRFYEYPEKISKYKVDDLEFETVPLVHSHVNLAYKISLPGGAVAISGDTRMCGNINELFMNTRAVAIEMTCVTKEHPIHLTMTEHLIPLTEMMTRGQELFLYHFAYDTEDIYRKLKESEHPDAGRIFEILERKNIIIAEDMKEYKVRETVYS
jgi:ribonuclease BN (tRNA processing enzyme)